MKKIILIGASCYTRAYEHLMTINKKVNNKINVTRLIRFLIKERRVIQEMSFLDKIKLINKKVYILGGFGLIGSKVVKNILSLNGQVIILDINKKQISKNIKYEKFDCTGSNIVVDRWPDNHLKKSVN